MNEQQEMVMDAFGHAFKFYGGVQQRVIIYNPKTMIINVIPLKERVYNSHFLAMLNY